MHLRNVPFRDAAFVTLSRSLAKPVTVRSYQRWLDLVDPTIGGIRCGDITPGDVRAALVEARKRQLSAKSVTNILGTVRLVLREAGCAESAAGIRVPQESRKLRPLGADQAKMLRDSLEPFDDLPETAIKVLLGTGVRVGELLELLPDDYDTASKRLRVAGVKTANAGRVVDVPDWLHPDLCALAERATSVHRIFDRLTPDRIRRSLHRALSRLRLPRIRIHDLRHTRFTCLLLSGAPVLYVSEQAGHSSPAYTMRVYGHIATATDAERRRWCNV